MVAKLTQSMIWADFILEREAIFKPVILRRIFESPMIEKSGDILMTLSVTDARKKGNGSFRAQVLGLNVPLPNNEAVSDKVHGADSIKQKTSKYKERDVVNHVDVKEPF